MNIEQVFRNTDRRGQEEGAFRRPESRCADIIDFLPDATFVIDRERRVIAWNRAMEKMTGVSADEMLGKGECAYACPFYNTKRPILIDFAFSPDMNLKRYYTRVRRDGNTTMAEAVTLKPDGKKAFLWGIATPFYAEGGEVVGAIESIRDITEWREAEKRLRESDERYRTVFENSGTAMVIVEEGGIISLVNAESEKMFGYAREEVLGKTRWDAMIAPHDRERLCRMFLGHRREPDSAIRRFEAGVVDAWGNIKHGLFTVARIPGMQSHVVSIIDITDRKEAEEKVDHLNRVLFAIRNVNELIVRERDRERLLQRICTTLIRTRGYFSVWIALLDASANCTAAAQAGLGDAFLPMLERLRRGNLTACTQRAFDRGGVIAIEDPGRECADSPLAPMYDAWGLMAVRLEHGGKVYGLLAATTPKGLVADREEQELFEELADDIGYALHNLELEDGVHYRDALKKANKKLNLLGSITRHDILNQLNPLFGYADLLEEAAVESPVQVEYIGGIRNAARRIRRQISFTRDYEDLGVRAPEWQRVEAVVALAAKSVAIERIDLVVTTGRLEVFADPLLEKVFGNLLENAVRHGEQVTEIRVSFVDPGVVVVEDNGVGVPAALKQQIFDRAVGKHTGLGLFLAREILGITGISIRETGVPGEGARFEIVVPEKGWRVVSG